MLGEPFNDDLLGLVPEDVRRVEKTASFHAVGFDVNILVEGVRIVLLHLVLLKVREAIAVGIRHRVVILRERVVPPFEIPGDGDAVPVGVVIGVIRGPVQVVYIHLRPVRDFIVIITRLVHVEPDLIIGTVVVTVPVTVVQGIVACPVSGPVVVLEVNLLFFHILVSAPEQSHVIAFHDGQGERRGGLLLRGSLYDFIVHKDAIPGMEERLCFNPAGARDVFADVLFSVDVSNKIKRRRRFPG